MIWPWRAGETFEFFLRKQSTADGKYTDARYYLHDRGARR